MAAKTDGGAPDSEAAAHKRWLVTIAITILFGTFGAVMTYMSYAKSSKPWSGRAPSSVPATTATPPAEQPPAEEPSSEGDGDDKGKPDKEK